MARRNAFAAKMMAAKAALSMQERQALIHRVLTTVYQASAVALHEEFGFGPERITRFRETMEAVIMEYGDLLSGTDADYADGKLEEQYNKIVGGGGGE